MPRFLVNLQAAGANRCAGSVAANGAACLPGPETRGRRTRTEARAESPAHGRRVMATKAQAQALADWRAARTNFVQAKLALAAAETEALDCLALCGQCKARPALPAGGECARCVALRAWWLRVYECGCEAGCWKCGDP